MILETFLLKNTKLLENFQEASAKDASAEPVKYSTTTIVIVLAIVLAISIFYIGGAVVLSVNYNNYVGTSSGLRIVYGILVFFFPSFYYPFYAWFLNPVKGTRLRNTMPRI